MNETVSQILEAKEKIERMGPSFTVVILNAVDEMMLESELREISSGEDHPSLGEVLGLAVMGSSAIPRNLQVFFKRHFDAIDFIHEINDGDRPVNDILADYLADRKACL